LLSSDWANANYAHFLLDGLARIDLFLRAGYKLADIDTFFCAPFNKNCEGLLTNLGIPLDRCVFSKSRAIRADVVIAPSFPGTRRNSPRWVVEFLRRRFVTQSVRPTRKLYIPRTTSRHVANENQLLPVLYAHGFEIYDPARDPKSIQTFAEAKIIVAAHSAALAGLAFCQPGIKVLELVPSDHVFPYWLTLSQAAELDYAYLVGASVGQRPPNATGPSPYDFTVDEGEFRDALTEIARGN